MPLPPLSSTLRQQLLLPLDSKDLAVPEFAALYRYLCDAILEQHDASTSATNEAYASEGTEQEVKEWWTENVRNTILTKALREACITTTPEPGGLELSASTRELGVLIAAYMNHEIRPTTSKTGIESQRSRVDVEDLMAEDIQNFKGQIDEIARKTGQFIQGCDKTIRDMLSRLPPETTLQPTTITTTAGLSSRIPTTSGTSTRKHQTTSHTSPSTSSNLLRSQIEQHTENLTERLPAQLTTLTQTLQALLETQAALLTKQIQHLETFTHSTQSRNLSTHATFLATVSKGIALKAQILSLLREKETYAQEGIHEALRSQYDRVLREDEDLVRQERDLNSLLSEYAREGGEDTFRTLGVEYARVEAEIDLVKLDIERLENR